MSGTGFRHFEKILRDLHGSFDFTKIFLIAISNDFERPHWYPMYEGDMIRFCDASVTKDACAKSPNVAQIIPIDLALREINKQYIPASTQWYRNTGIPWNTNVLTTSHLYNHSRHFKRRQATPPQGKRINSDQIAVLRRIRSNFPDIEVHFIHLPQKAEVRSQQYSVDLESDLQNLDIQYFPALRDCKWHRRLYFTKDAHPNHHGYRRVAECVGGYLQTIAKNDP